MEVTPITLVLDSLARAKRVPAYRRLLEEAGVNPDKIQNLADFQQLPVLEKKDTFQRFDIAELCVDGELGRLGSVLTSSGHSGVFSFGVTDAEALSATSDWIDNFLDGLFAVRSRRTLLINCLPMGVKIPTLACTLAETSVRPDMAVGLVHAFGEHFAQIILVGETAFIKHVLETGRKAGVNWPSLRVHVIVGEEPLAENARGYLEGILGIDPRQADHALIFSSMGVAELGLNLFSEVPPVGPLISLRRALHENRALRNALLGPRNWVPSLFTYDPRRIFVEFDHGGRLILTTLDPGLRIPLIRYATGDHGGVLTLRPELHSQLEAAGISWALLDKMPVVWIEGRGDYACAGEARIFPEAVKEGLYRDPALAELTTANFRVVSGPERARIRIQLSPGVAASVDLEKEFETAISFYVDAAFEVNCEVYETFQSGMTLDYERKFSYLGR